MEPSMHSMFASAWMGYYDAISCSHVSNTCEHPVGFGNGRIVHHGRCRQRKRRPTHYRGEHPPTADGATDGTATPAADATDDAARAERERARCGQCEHAPAADAAAGRSETGSWSARTDAAAAAWDGPDDASADGNRNTDENPAGCAVGDPHARIQPAAAGSGNAGRRERARCRQFGFGKRRKTGIAAIRFASRSANPSALAAAAADEERRTATA